MHNYIADVKQNRNILHSMLNPITELSSRINSNIHIELANNYWGLNLCNPNQVWNYAKQIHDSLESLI